MAQRAPRGYSFAQTEIGRLVAGEIQKRFRATLHGVEHLPRSSGALLVGNHAYFAVDSWILSAALISECNVVPRFLADKNLFRIPGMRQFLTTFGSIPGKPEEAIALLEAGQIVAVYPGGVDDSFKLSSEAYTLQWQKRAGFARVAMKAKVPIIPVAATGVDELFQIDERETFLGRSFGGSPRYDLPLSKSFVPKSVPLDYYLLEPIDTSGDPTNEVDVERVRLATENALRSILDPYRERLVQTPS